MLGRTNTSILSGISINATTDEKEIETGQITAGDFVEYKVIKHEEEIGGISSTPVNISGNLFLCKNNTNSIVLMRIDKSPEVLDIALSDVLDFCIEDENIYVILKNSIHKFHVQGNTLVQDKSGTFSSAQNERVRLFCNGDKIIALNFYGYYGYSKVEVNIFDKSTLDFIVNKSNSLGSDYRLEASLISMFNGYYYVIGRYFSSSSTPRNTPFRLLKISIDEDTGVVTGQGYKSFDETSGSSSTWYYDNGYFIGLINSDQTSGPTSWKGTKLCKIDLSTMSEFINQEIHPSNKSYLIMPKETNPFNNYFVLAYCIGHYSITGQLEYQRTILEVYKKNVYGYEFQCEKELEHGTTTTSIGYELSAIYLKDDMICLFFDNKVRVLTLSSDGSTIYDFEDKSYVKRWEGSGNPIGVAKDSGEQGDVIDVYIPSV